MTAKVDYAWNRRDRRVRRHVRDLVGSRVHGVHGTGEAALDDVEQELVPDATGFAAGTDHGHRLRGEEAMQRAVLCRPLPIGDPLEGCGVVRGVEHQFHHAAVHCANLLESGADQYAQHLGVLAQSVGAQPFDAVLPGRRRELLQQEGPDPAAVHGVLQQEGHLRLTGAERFVARDTDDVVAVLGHQCHVSARLGRKVMGVVIGHGPTDAEEPQVDRLVRHPRVHGRQRRFVIHADRPDPNHRPIHRQHVPARPRWCTRPRDRRHPSSLPHPTSPLRQVPPGQCRRVPAHRDLRL